MDNFSGFTNEMLLTELVELVDGNAGLKDTIKAKAPPSVKVQMRKAIIQNNATIAKFRKEILARMARF